MNTITLQLLRVPLHVLRGVLSILPATISDRLKGLLVRGHYLDNLGKGTPIIVYQMGKVGSHSIRDSLISYGVGPVFHLHLMNPYSIMKRKQENLAHNYTPPPLHNNVPRTDEWLGKTLYNEIVKKDISSKFIIPVREPIDRNVSAFF